MIGPRVARDAAHRRARGPQRQRRATPVRRYGQHRRPRAGAQRGAAAGGCARTPARPREAARRRSSLLEVPRVQARAHEQARAAAGAALVARAAGRPPAPRPRPSALPGAPARPACRTRRRCGGAGRGSARRTSRAPSRPPPVHDAWRDRGAPACHRPYSGGASSGSASGSMHLGLARRVDDPRQRGVWNGSCAPSGHGADVRCWHRAACSAPPSASVASAGKPSGSAKPGLADVHRPLAQTRAARLAPSAGAPAIRSRRPRRCGSASGGRPAA